MENTTQKAPARELEERIAALIVMHTHVDCEGCIQGEGDTARQILIEMGTPCPRRRRSWRPGGPHWRQRRCWSPTPRGRRC